MAEGPRGAAQEGNEGRKEPEGPHGHQENSREAGGAGGSWNWRLRWGSSRAGGSAWRRQNTELEEAEGPCGPGGPGGPGPGARRLWTGLPCGGTPVGCARRLQVNQRKSGQSGPLSSFPLADRACLTRTFPETWVTFWNVPTSKSLKNWVYAPSMLSPAGP